MEGYDAKFDPPLDKRLECPICLLAQREPMQTPCGHRFCSACILRALRETGPRCPVDNTRVAVHQLFKDNFAKREVLSLHVCCHANEQGCSWQGELRKLETHEKVCSLISMQCPNECGHQCQRKDLYEHLPNCPNQSVPCHSCSISFVKSKFESHTQFCSKIKLPDSTLSDIAKNNEILKWSGHLKMKLHGQSYSATGYLTASMDSDERFIYSGCWSSNIGLIPLTGPAARIFWHTLQGPEVKPVDLYFNVLTIDSRATSFQRMIKKKINAVVGLRLKPASRRELMIIYIHWNESRKRMLACVAELKNYLVREMQSKLQQLKRTSHFPDITLESSRPGPSHRGSGPSSSHTPGDRQPLNRAYNNVRIVNVPPPGSVSMETPSHMTPASHVLPSILSWQLSPSFPAYPWRATHSVPFFTIPSTPPQFLPAHSYPYTFAPMPAAAIAAAAPPFSINHHPGAIPASIAIPSYAGVTVPQVTGLHAELVVSSSNGQTRNSEVNNTGVLPTAAVIHSFPPANPMPHPVSVVVDHRIAVPPDVPEMGVVSSERSRWARQWGHRGNWSYDLPTSSGGLSSSQSSRQTTNDDTRPPAITTTTTSQQQQQQQSHVISSPSSVNSPSSLPFFSPLTTPSNSSSDDELSDITSPFPPHWRPHPPGMNHSNPSHVHENSGMSSSIISSDESSPTSQQRAMGSALQTLADAAALLSSSSPYEMGSSDEELPNERERNGVTDIDNIVPSSSTFPSSAQLPNDHHGNLMGVPTQGYAPALVPNYHHHHHHHHEDLPVFVPVIHPTVDPHEPNQLPAPVPSQILYAPQEGGVVLPPQQPIAEIPPLIHVAQGSGNIPGAPDPWPTLVEPVPAAAYIHSSSLLPAASIGGFWEEVMPSLDMRLHESHTHQPTV